MEAGAVHYEVFIRRTPASGWALDMATEDRGRAIETAEAAMAEGRACAVRVSKETLDPETREFRCIDILTRGDMVQAKPKVVREDLEPLCVSPSDLYTVHARERIGRLLDSWLARERATPFELLHRSDLIETLDASGMELQHAIQKIAIPEAQERGLSVHEVIRSFQRLVQATIDRVLKDARRGVLPDLACEDFAATAERLVHEPDRHYLLGAGVAAIIGRAATWTHKVGVLLDLADAAPPDPAARTLAFQVLEQPLAEILGSRTGLADLLGQGLDLGGQLAAMTRLAAAEQVELLISIEPQVAQIMPPFKGAAARLANWLDGPHFDSVRAAIAGRVLRELTGPRRLCAEAEAEIAILRALAMALTAAAGRLLPLEQVQEAFIDRSRMLVRADFVETYLGQDRSARGEVEALLVLGENITGAANKRACGRWIAANVAALRFETEARYGPDAPTVKLAALAALQRALTRAGLVEEEAGPIRERIGEVGGMIEADAKLAATVARATAPVLHRLTLLLRMAAGEAAPLGAAAERARAEVLKLIRTPEGRGALAQSPEALARVRDLMQVGQAA